MMNQVLTAAKPAQSLPLQGISVLVVEDHDDSRQLIRMILRQAGADVSTASNSASGFELFLQLRPDVLVSDIGMPEETGYDLIRKIRRLGADQGGDTPAIALTAWTRNEEITAAFRAGFQIHIPKPLNASALVHAVTELLDQNDEQ